MAGPARFELTTNSLRGYCSTIELRTLFTLRSFNVGVARPAGVEPATLWSEATRSIH